MAGIDDLGTGRQEPGDLLTAGQMALYVKAHGADRSCEACGGDHFIMCPESNAVFVEARGLVILACRQCNVLRQFLRPPVMAWLRSARHA